MRRLFRWLERLIALCLATMAAAVFANVALRYLFNSGLAVAEEVARLCFVWLVFLGAVVAMRERAHIGVQQMIEALPVPARKACLAASGALTLAALALLLHGAVKQFVIGLDDRMPVTGLPNAALYAAVVLSAAGLFAMVAADLRRLLTGRLRDRELVMVRETAEAVPQPPEAGRP